MASNSDTSTLGEEFGQDASAVAGLLSSRKKKGKNKKNKGKAVKMVITVGFPAIFFVLVFCIIFAAPMGITSGIKDNRDEGTETGSSDAATPSAEPSPQTSAVPSSYLEYSEPVIKFTGDVAESGESEGSGSERGKATEIQEWADKTDENLGENKWGFDKIKDGIVDFFKNKVLSFLTGGDRAQEMKNLEEAALLIIDSAKENDGSETEYAANTAREVAATYKYFVDAYVDILIEAKGNNGTVVKVGKNYIKEHVVDNSGEISETGNSVVEKHETVELIPGPTVDSPPQEITSTVINQYVVKPVYNGDSISDFFTPVFYLLSANSSAQSMLGAGTTDEDYAMTSILKTAEERAPDTFSLLVGTNQADVAAGEEPTFDFGTDGGPDQTETTYDYTMTESGPVITGSTTTNTYFLFAPFSIIAKDESLVELMIAAGAEDPENNEKHWIEAQFERLCKFFGGITVQEVGDWERADLSSNFWDFANSLNAEQIQEMLEKLKELAESGQLSEAQSRIIELFNQIASSANPTAEARSLGLQVDGGFCLAFVEDFLALATGQPRNSYGSTMNAWNATGGNTSDPPPDGACVFAYSHISPEYGHVGIYVGGYVIDCIASNGTGVVKVYTFEDWKAQSYMDYLGWGTCGYDLAA